MWWLEPLHNAELPPYHMYLSRVSLLVCQESDLLLIYTSSSLECTNTAKTKPQASGEALDDATKVIFEAHKNGTTKKCYF